ncbi:MAG: hypothetical protein Q7S43_05235 [bacterium]|nr:hypothetical protein [bacterium]
MLLDNILGWLVQNASIVNLVVALAIFGVGAAIFVAKPEFLSDRHPGNHDALLFWLFQWGTFLFIYGFLSFWPDLPLLLLLCLVDLQSVFGVGFFVAYLHGDAYKPGPVWRKLFLFGFVWAALDLCLGLLAANQPSGSFWRQFWVAPSELLSATSLVMVGGVFVLRLGKIAWPMLVATAFYGVLQRPVYASLFIDRQPEPRLILALVAGKLIMGWLFYVYFLAPIGEYPARPLPPIKPAVVAHIKRWLKRTAYFLGLAGFILEELIRRVLFP